MKKSGIFPRALIAMFILVLSIPAYSADEKWLIHARVIDVSPDEDGSVAVGGKPDISSDTVLEVDFNYFITPNWSLELILATTEHDVAWKGSVLGDLEVGSVKLLPPTFSALYHFGGEKFIPYVGAGINYTHFYDVDDGQFDDVEYDDNFGYLIQAGFDYALNDKWTINLDIKKVYLDTEVTIDAGDLGIVKADVDIDPLIIGIGIGYRF